MTPVQPSFKFNFILRAVNSDGCYIIFNAINGNVEVFTVYLEFILTHFLGVFLKVKVLSFHAVWRGVKVMMPGSTS